MSDELGGGDGPANDNVEVPEAANDNEAPEAAEGGAGGEASTGGGQGPNEGGQEPSEEAAAGGDDVDATETGGEDADLAGGDQVAGGAPPNQGEESTGPADAAAGAPETDNVEAPEAANDNSPPDLAEGDAGGEGPNPGEQESTTEPANDNVEVPEAANDNTAPEAAEVAGGEGPNDGVDKPGESGQDPASEAVADVDATKAASDDSPPGEQKDESGEKKSLSEEGEQQDDRAADGQGLNREEENEEREALPPLPPRDGDPPRHPYQYGMPWRDDAMRGTSIEEKAALAAEAQGNPKYPGIDPWEGKDFEGGEIIAVLHPGQGGFCTPASSLEQTGFDSRELSRGLQVRPQNGMFRDEVTLYRLKSPVGGAESRAQANSERRTGERPSKQLDLPGISPGPRTEHLLSGRDGGLTQYYFPCDLAGHPDLFEPIGTFSLLEIKQNPDLRTLLNRPPKTQR